eukprot:5512924-Lingulodinium_polyedra.AAC.1
MRQERKHKHTCFGAKIKLGGRGPNMGELSWMNASFANAGLAYENDETSHDDSNAELVVRDCEPCPGKSKPMAELSCECEHIAQRIDV